jgi:DNA-binding response OmpR family regulator
MLLPAAGNRSKGAAMGQTDLAEGARLMLVEDDAALGEALLDALRSAGYAVSWLQDGAAATSVWQRDAFDLVVLDLGLPGRDGLTVLRECRGAGRETAVLILTARDQPQDRVTGLDAGADDYLVKPFHLGELLARCRALLRRRSPGEAPRDNSPVRIDEAQRRVWFEDREVRLTVSEFELLLLFHRNADRVLSRDRLESVLARSARTPGSNTLDVYVHRLRRKLDARLIRTVHGIGYRYEPGAAEAP